MEMGLLLILVFLTLSLEVKSRRRSEGWQCLEVKSWIDVLDIIQINISSILGNAIDGTQLYDVFFQKELNTRHKF